MTGKGGGEKGRKGEDENGKRRRKGKKGEG